MAVTAAALVSGCSVGDDTPDIIPIGPYDNQTNGTVQNCYWIIDGERVGDCQVVVKTYESYTLSDNYPHEMITFANVPWGEICRKLIEDEALAGAKLQDDGTNKQAELLSMALTLIGYSANDESAYYDCQTASHSFIVTIDGEERKIVAQISGAAVITTAPNRTITSSLMIATITDNGEDKTLKSPLKMVCVAKF